MNALTEKLATLTPKQMSQIYQNVFSTIDGQLVLEDLRHRCFSYAPEDLGVSSDREVFINVGKHAVIVNIETQLRPYSEEEK